MDKIYYKSGFKYQLHATYTHKLKVNPNQVLITEYLSLDASGVLTIRKGYAWDGPSGPTYDSKNSMRGSLIHDALYQLIRMQRLPSSYRKPADKELYRVCRKDGMFYLRAKAWYLSVRKGAKKAASPKSVRATKVAP